MDLSQIRLITFDVFGTVLNWKSFVEGTLSLNYQSFLTESELLQRRLAPVLPYSDLLITVADAIGVKDMRLKEILAHRMGTALPFQDAKAIGALRNSVLVGCVSNSDFRHQSDVQRTLGLAWDITLLSQACGAYKPAMKIWEWAVKSVATELRVKPHEWLHVSAYADYDLIPAAQLGINTCFVPRPGGSPATVISELGSDVLIVSDLFELVAEVRKAQGVPVIYQVNCSTPSESVAEDFKRWMRYEHGEDLLGIDGCISFQVASVSVTAVRCEYVFKNQIYLDKYFAQKASVLRQKSLDRFGEGTLNYSRSILTLEQTGQDRKGMLEMRHGKDFR